MMDPNVDPLIKFMAFKELAKLHDEFEHARKPRHKNSMLKKHLIVAIRNFGRTLVRVGSRLEQA
jgi:hypothetical protein